MAGSGASMCRHNASKYNIDTPESIKYCKLPIADPSPPDWNMDGILIILSVSDSTQGIEGCNVHILTLDEARIESTILPAQTGAVMWKYAGQ